MTTITTIINYSNDKRNILLFINSTIFRCIKIKFIKINQISYINQTIDNRLSRKLTSINNSKEIFRSRLLKINNIVLLTIRSRRLRRFSNSEETCSICRLKFSNRIVYNLSMITIINIKIDNCLINDRIRRRKISVLIILKKMIKKIDLKKFFKQIKIIITKAIT